VTGIVSEIDVFSKKGKVARDIMSSHVITVSEDTGIDEAARLLIGERIRRVPVIKHGKMVGLLSRSDVLDFFASTRWTCNVCGRWERGLEMPERCHSCSSTDIHLERADPGH
jgi:predicted transcriptional regulator